MAASLGQGVEIRKERADERRRAGSTAEVLHECNERRTAEHVLEMTSNHRSTTLSTSKLPRRVVVWALCQQPMSPTMDLHLGSLLGKTYQGCGQRLRDEPWWGFSTAGRMRVQAEEQVAGNPG